METHTPNYVKQGQEWRPNLNSQSFEGNRLFKSDDGFNIYHGDTYFARPDFPEKRILEAIAHWRFEYNDGRGRYKFKENIAWL